MILKVLSSLPIVFAVFTAISTTSSAQSSARSQFMEMTNVSDTVRDAQGNIIAHIKDEGDSIRIRDDKFKTLGWYNKKRNITTDALYRKIGDGDQLMRLIPAR